MFEVFLGVILIYMLAGFVLGYQIGHYRGQFPRKADDR